MPLLEGRNLVKSFHRGGLWKGGGAVRKAVDGVSFAVGENETLAIVGESGSGKSTTARLAMRLLEVDSGSVHLMGEEITQLSGKALRQQRRHIQMVFQDPFASLNPRMRIVDTVGEGLRVHRPELSGSQRRDRVAEVLELCGLGSEVLDRYPHQFSGGQRQRIGVARALVVEPKVLVLDEPVSALDVSVQAQVLNLLKQLQQERRLSYLFISHDLSVVRHVANRVAVMFAGRIVEEGSVQQVFEAPKHPYTRALLDARPINHPAERAVPLASGRTTDEGIADSGCAYRLRCPNAQEDCARFDYEVTEIGGQRFTCLHPNDRGA